ncbi:MAG: hypothetical protein MZV64_15380 [Ignavibacteriales bacterium]|nr:hypothetical protein [Ignavibacteriales bacterium]
MRPAASDSGAHAADGWRRVVRPTSTARRRATRLCWIAQRLRRAADGPA